MHAIYKYEQTLIIHTQVLFYPWLLARKSKNKMHLQSLPLKKNLAIDLEVMGGRRRGLKSPAGKHACRQKNQGFTQLRAGGDREYIRSG